MTSDDSAPAPAIVIVPAEPRGANAGAFVIEDCADDSEEERKTDHDEPEVIYMDTASAPEVCDVDEWEAAEPVKPVQPQRTRRDRGERQQQQQQQQQQEESYALAAYEPESAVATANNKFLGSINQPNKQEDDSSVSFGDTVAQTIGDWQYAPSAPPLEDLDDFDEMAPPEYEPMDDQTKSEYEAWLRATQITVRQQFKHHKKWELFLKRTGQRRDFQPRLTPAELPDDQLSEDFKKSVQSAFGGKPKNKTEEMYKAFTAGVKPLEDFSNYRYYVPKSFSKEFLAQERKGSEAVDEKKERKRGDKLQVPGTPKPPSGPSIASTENNEKDWLAVHTDRYDELQGLIEYTDQKYHTSFMNPTKQTVPADHMWIISDHNGSDSGEKMEVWGPGVKPTFAAAKANRKNKVQGAPENIQINTEYCHVPGRFTIVLILPNELGFVWDKNAAEIKLVLPGRYFLRERYDNYIGKASVSLGETTPVVMHKDNQQKYIRDLASRLFCVCVAQGHSALCMSGEGAFMAEWRPQPWIVDTARDQQFVKFVRLSARIAGKANMYHIVNLQQGEYIVFRDHRSHAIVWSYDYKNPEMNHIHLPDLYFKFDGLVHKITEGTKSLDKGNLVVLYNEPSDFVVLRDPQGHVHFFEDTTKRIHVLRQPWRYVETQPKANRNHVYDRGDGRRVWRVMLSPSEWAVAQTMAGEIKFFPPLLQPHPLYFYQPHFTIHGIVNRFAKEVQQLEVPGYKISVVNLATGELGACRIRNVNMFLNPRPMNPYVFVSPDEFLGKADVNETHFQAGDLHMVRVRSDERVCVIRDGEAMLLPSEDNNLAKENKGNGVYIFRARQKLEVLGPHKKIEDRYELGPWQFFNVPPGHVGYGTKAGKLNVWGEGQGVANVSNNEQFSGFFQTNVDPVVRENVEVMCKHAITSKLKITVTYMIEEPKKTIYTFGGDHGKLHRFVESLAISGILELCAKRPPMGFSESDFDPSKDMNNEKKKSKLEEEQTDKSKVAGELLHKLRSHPEVIRAGIHIGFAEIQEWKIDERFMKSSKEIAMKLQEIHAVTERKRMELQQQTLDNQRGLAEERSKIEQQELILKQEQQRAEAAKVLAVVQAQKEAETMMAHAEAEANALASRTKGEADAQLAKKAAKLREGELEAENRKILAMAAQQQQAIENETNLKRAEGEANMRAVALTAEKLAEARADKAAADLQLAAAQTLLESMKLKAEGELALATAQAQGEQLKAEALINSKFPGVAPDVRAQCLLTEMMLQTQSEMAKQVRQVYHTMDPSEAQRMYESQMKNMMAMSQAVRGYGYLPGGQNLSGLKGGLSGMGGFGMPGMGGQGGMGMGMGMGVGTGMGMGMGMPGMMNGGGNFDHEVSTDDAKNKAKAKELTRAELMAQLDRMNRESA